MAKGCLPFLSYVLEKENISKGKAGAAWPVPRAAGHAFRDGISCSGGSVSLPQAEALSSLTSL